MRRTAGQGALHAPEPPAGKNPHRSPDFCPISIRQPCSARSKCPQMANAAAVADKESQSIIAKLRRAQLLKSPISPSLRFPRGSGEDQVARKTRKAFHESGDARRATPRRRQAGRSPRPLREQRPSRSIRQAVCTPGSAHSCQTPVECPYNGLRTGHIPSLHRAREHLSSRRATRCGDQGQPR